MTPEIEKLLSVLDMTEEEQLSYINNLWQNRKIPEEYNLLPDMDGDIKPNLQNRRILADLAFRLRDEAKNENEIKWLQACYIIINGKLNNYADVADGHDAEYEVLKRVSITWIIAAKIAEQLAVPERHRAGGK